MNNFVKYKEKSYIAAEKENAIESRWEKLPSGVYKPNLIGMFNPITVYEPIKNTEQLIKFKGGKIAATIKQIGNFLGEDCKKTYSQLKVAHKLGMILYGPPGTGKTCTAFLIMQEAVSSYNAVSLDCTGYNVNYIIHFIEEIRKIQDNPLIIFVDEFDSAIKKEEEAYLTFLDGINSHENLIVVGCTNNINEIPERIKYRPSRIKYNIEIKSFPMEVYKQFIYEKMNAIEEKELSKFAYIAEDKGLTLDELKHVIIDHKIENIDIEEAINNVKKYS